MGELVYGDLPAAVLARFAGNSAAQAAIDAALAAVRRYCGWHVSPVRTGDVLTDLDGPGGRVLSLPTLNLIATASVTELGVAVDVTTLDRSRRKGTLTKQFGYWTCRDGAITATITHGFTEAEAADWRQAILRLVDIKSKEPTSQRDDPAMSSKKIDDVEYQWFQTVITTDDQLSSLFSAFRILPSP